MNISECSVRLRELTDLHTAHKLAFEDYRAQRKFLLDSVDKQYNGVVAEKSELPAQPIFQVEKEESDKTQPYLTSKIGQCINFLKRKN